MTVSTSIIGTTKKSNLYSFSWEDGMNAHLLIILVLENFMQTRSEVLFEDVIDRIYT